MYQIDYVIIGYYFISGIILLVTVGFWIKLIRKNRKIKMEKKIDEFINNQKKDS